MATPRRSFDMSRIASSSSKSLHAAKFFARSTSIAL
jgi:hypothetical protein